MLLEAGSDPTYKNNCGLSALEYFQSFSISSSHKTIYDLLSAYIKTESSFETNDILERNPPTLFDDLTEMNGINKTCSISCDTNPDYFIYNENTTETYSNIINEIPI